MQRRRIYAFDSVESARTAVMCLRAAGIPLDGVSLVARADIELEQVPSTLVDTRVDCVPLRQGVAIGGATGLFAGIVAMAVPPLGLAIGGPLLLAFLAGGAALGAWTSTVAGASESEDIRNMFRDEIEAGRVLLVVDADRLVDEDVPAKLIGSIEPHLLRNPEANSSVAA
ncbi:MAG TPA: hypothetical protein VFB32_01120 [Rudaea sp.]|nr:hypothetical protein [Rudaea sp.]